MFLKRNVSHRNQIQFHEVQYQKRSISIFLQLPRNKLFKKFLKIELNFPFFKLKYIISNCLKKKNFFLLFYRRKCPSPCLQKEVTRKLAPVSPRILQLAKPRRNHILKTIQHSSNVLPSELIDNLIRMLETESSLSPEYENSI